MTRRLFPESCDPVLVDWELNRVPRSWQWLAVYQNWDPDLTAPATTDQAQTQTIKSGKAPSWYKQVHHSLDTACRKSMSKQISQVTGDWIHEAEAHLWGNLSELDSWLLTWSVALVVLFAVATECLITQEQDQDKSPPHSKVTKFWSIDDQKPQNAIKCHQLGNETWVPENPGNPVIFKPVYPGLGAVENPGLTGLISTEKNCTKSSYREIRVVYSCDTLTLQTVVLPLALGSQLSVCCATVISVAYWQSYTNHWRLLIFAVHSSHSGRGGARIFCRWTAVHKGTIPSERYDPGHTALPAHILSQDYEHWTAFASCKLKYFEQ